MAIHIGTLIRQQLEQTGMSKSEFARRINTTPQNIHGIFKRKSIDTDSLAQISDVLNHDFFQYFTIPKHLVKESGAQYKSGKGIKSYSELLAELDELKKEADQLRKENALLRELNQLLKEKHEKGKGKK